MSFVMSSEAETSLF